MPWIGFIVLRTIQLLPGESVLCSMLYSSAISAVSRLLSWLPRTAIQGPVPATCSLLNDQGAVLIPAAPISFDSHRWLLGEKPHKYFLLVLLAGLEGTKWIGSALTDLRCCPKTLEKIGVLWLYLEKLFVENSEAKITVIKVLDKTALHSSLEKWALAWTLK